MVAVYLETSQSGSSFVLFILYLMSRFKPSGLETGYAAWTVCRNSKPRLEIEQLLIEKLIYLHVPIFSTFLCDTLS